MKNVMNFYHTCRKYIYESPTKYKASIGHIALYFGLLATLNTNAQEYVTIPDHEFERRLIIEGIDKDGENGKVLRNSVDTVINLNVVYAQIDSLTGIEAFTALKSLNCSQNNLRQLDLSKNKKLLSLNVGSNKLSNLNLEENILLEKLYCEYNFLGSLDLRKNAALQLLDCSYNRVKNIDLSNSLTLTHLYCFNNKLASIDVTHNTELKILSCGKNFIEQINVTQNIALTGLFCSENQLKSLDLTSNVLLVDLSCHHNELTTLDVSQSPLLEDFSCYNNELKKLDISHNSALKWVSSSANPDLKTICVADTIVRFNFHKDDITKWVMDCNIPTGISSKELQNNIALYPNPSSGVFSVQVPKDMDAEVINAMGIHVTTLYLRTGHNEVSLTLEHGIYYINIEGNRIKFAIQ